MRKNSLRINALIFFIFTFVVIFFSCGEKSGTDAASLNDTELLTTVDVVKLLNENGAKLTKATDFPIDLSLCKISEKIPQTFVSGETGIYYLFYVFDGYSESNELKRQSLVYEFPGTAKEFSDSLIPSDIRGKNLYIYQWDPKFGAWKNNSGTFDKEFFDTAMEERTEIVEILWHKAFNEKLATYIGKSESWEVKIPIAYINNVRKNKDGAPEIVFISEGETYVKYLISEEEPPVVTSMSWAMGGSGSSLTHDKGEGSILSKEAENGYYRASNGQVGCNPEQINNITVTITCENGDTEEVICTIQKSRN